jgi:hypothetical protein
MGSRQVGNWFAIILVVLNFLVILGIFNIWWGQAEPVHPSRAPKAPDIPVAPMLRNQQNLNDFRDVAARNLFSQDRTGPELVAAGRPGQGSLEGKLLLGTIIIGNQRVALIGGAPLRKPKDITAEAVRLGEQWDGYTIIEITKDSVVFQGRNGNTTLQFPE